MSISSKSDKQNPTFKLDDFKGKMIYFNREKLDEWLQQNRVKSNREINQAADNHIGGVA